jgi:hypothetical protein
MRKKVIIGIVLVLLSFVIGYLVGIKISNNTPSIKKNNTNGIYELQKRLK